MRDAQTITGELIASGLSQPQTTLLMELVLVLSAQKPAEIAESPVIERRRAWDRERKRLQRGLRVPESEWFQLVAEVLERDGHKCAYCGATEKLTADHVVPLTRGGSNEPSNLAACCIPCNTKKSNKLVTEWLPASSTVFHPNVHHNPPDLNSTPFLVRKNIEDNNRKRGEKRGTRLPPDWQVSSDDRLFANQLSWSDAEIDNEAANFRDYWIAKPGSGGLKLDWPATWRKWIRSNKGQRSNQTTAKPLTEFQRKQAETNDIRAQLRSYANGVGGGREADRLLSVDHGERSEGVRGGPGAGILALPRASGSGGG